jgi:hypothetical protein
MATATQITTGKVRFSFVHLFTPQTFADGGPAKYGVTLLIPKADKATLAKIKTAIEAAKTAFLARNPGKKLPKELPSTLWDGDGVRQSGDEFGPECKGCYVMTVSTTKPPVIVDSNKLPITDANELYSGCYGRAVINFYVYDYMGKRGVSAGLNGVMKLHDGEPLAGGVVSDSDWDDGWEDDDTDDLMG